MKKELRKKHILVPETNKAFPHRKKAIEYMTGLMFELLFLAGCSEENIFRLARKLKK